MIGQAKVLTVSDSVQRGSREDRSGPELVAALRAHGFEVIEHDVVGDGVESVATALSGMCAQFWGLVVTTGGTGFSPRDLTPEATRQVIDREAPGLAEAMRGRNPLGRLTRGVAGTFGTCLVVNLPGSTRGAIESIDSIIDVLPHVLELLGGRSAH